MDKREWQMEQERLNHVIEQLKARIMEMEPKVSDLNEQVTDIRRHFWEDVTVNTGTHEDFEETFYSINQQAAVLAERERTHALQRQQWKKLTRLLPSPYFGRIDFQEDGLNFSEQVYIGISSFLDDGGHFLIYDWRSPIASMYYDHSPGEAFYDAPSGRIKGKMELKRQYQIQGGKIQNMFDANLTIGDELLQQVLGKGADSQMKSIVATIQKEQNAIIRDDKKKMLIVQGAAGSGKTSAALQRVAYLLYKHRDSLTADQVLLFSPNPIFNSYVSTVLPELGEENMQQTTFQEYLESGLGAAFQLEDPFDQIEYVLTARSAPEYDARLQGINYKASKGFLNAINHYAMWLRDKGMRFNHIRFQSRILISSEQMKAQFYSYSSSLSLSDRIVLLQKWLANELAEREIEEMEAKWVDEELNYLDNDEYAEVFSQLHKERELFDIAEQYAEIHAKLHKQQRGDESDIHFAEQEEQLLRQKIVHERFKPLRRNVKKRRFVDVRGMYAQLFSEESRFREMTGEADVPSRWMEIGEITKERLRKRELFYEDATPYLYLKEMIEGVQTNAKIKYVFVDEGQDYSLFQYEYLKKLFPSARMTVLGDFRQAIFAQTTNLHDADSPLFHLYGEEETSAVRLMRSYRSTKEIVGFTKSLLPDGDDIIPFKRSGEKPLLVALESRVARDSRLWQDINSLKAEGFHSIAVITKTAAESREAFDSLRSKGDINLQLITKETLTYETGVMLIPVYLAKGVEFDAVIIYDASSQVYRQDNERKLLYTACTRAMHRLVLYSVQEWSPFVKLFDRKSLYE